MSEVDTIAADERRHRAEARSPRRDRCAKLLPAAHERSTPRGEQDDDGLVGKSLEELRLNPYRMTQAERARIFSMTEEEIEAAALADPDNLPLTDKLLERAGRAARRGEAQRESA